MTPSIASMDVTPNPLLIVYLHNRQSKQEHVCKKYQQDSREIQEREAKNHTMRSWAVPHMWTISTTGVQK